MKEFINQAGVIRAVLYVFAIITIIFKPDNSATLSFEGLQFIPTLILPVIAPLLVTGLLLDVLMSRIYASEQTDEIRNKFKILIRVDLTFAALLLLLWVPYMLSIN